MQHDLRPRPNDGNFSTPAAQNSTPSLSVSLFRGTKEENVDGWIALIEWDFRLLNTPAEVQTFVGLKALSGDAAKWGQQFLASLQTKGKAFNEITWETFKSEIREAFPVPRDKDIDTLFQLNNLKLGPNDNVDKYIETVKSLCIKCKQLPEDVALFFLLRGIEDQARTEILVREPKDVSDAIRIMRHLIPMIRDAKAAAIAAEKLARSAETKPKFIKDFKPAHKIQSARANAIEASMLIKENATLYGKSADLLVDSGCQVNIIHSGLVKKLNLVKKKTNQWVIKTIFQNEKIVDECVEIDFALQGQRFTEYFLVMELDDIDGILGQNFLKKHNVLTNHGNGTISFPKVQEVQICKTDAQLNDADDETAKDTVCTDESINEMLPTDKKQNENDALNENLHGTLGHLSYKKERQTLSAAGLDPNLAVRKDCIDCQLGKSIRSGIPSRKSPRTKEKFELVHSDVKGPMETPGFEGGIYILNFIDDYTRYCWSFILRKKSEAYGKIVKFLQMVQIQFKTTVKSLLTDNGGEYISKEMENKLAMMGIQHIKTAPNTPQQNGVAERLNGTLQTMARISLSQSGLAPKFWDLAHQHSVFTYNRCAHSALPNKSPYQQLLGKTPKLSVLIPFGCLAYLKRPLEKVGFGNANSIGIAVGYSEGLEFTYKLYLINDNRIIESRNCKFSPTKNILSLETALSANIVAAPKTLTQALKGPNGEAWKNAAQKEMEAIRVNGTFELVDLPPKRSAIKCRWVFTEKADFTFKARLVAKGFSQRPGVDFDETYSPTATMDSLRLLLSLAASNGWNYIQLDVSSAFLNGNLEEEIFMEQPEGYVDQQFPQKVWRLKKALYGLKQAPRVWNKTISHFFLEMGLTQCKTDQSIYSRLKNGKQLTVLLYVDDLLIFGSDPEEIQWLKDELFKRFKMNEIRDLSNFLGFEITKNEMNGSISINQNAFLRDLLSQFSFERPQRANTPIEPGTTLSVMEFESTDEDKEFMKDKPYRSVVGSLNYLACCSRPDISFVVNQLSRHLENPGKIHWEVVERVLSYLERIPMYSITYTADLLTAEREVQIKAYADANWGGGKYETRSTSGNAVILNNGIISWNCKTQRTTARSSTEAELSAFDLCSIKAKWFRDLLAEIGFGELCIPIYGDNLSAIAICTKAEMRERTKHVNIKHAAIRDFIDDGEIRIEYVPTEENWADAFTKSLTGPTLLKSIKAWGLYTLGGDVRA